MNCEPCAYAAEHGWWGPKHKGTHCRKCHRSWLGTTQAHCTACHEHFASNAAADRHRSVTGRCLDPETLVDDDGNPRLKLSMKHKERTWTRWYPEEWWTGLDPQED